MTFSCISLLPAMYIWSAGNFPDIAWWHKDMRLLYSIARTLTQRVSFLAIQDSHQYNGTFMQTKSWETTAVSSHGRHERHKCRRDLQALDDGAVLPGLADQGSRNLQRTEDERRYIEWSDKLCREYMRTRYRARLAVRAEESCFNVL
ncbi:uncharacterized protein K489DRAFT_379869 [Dissoconium aciculare CBS 342.82]|uniref:Uncharacterized protein n=1 Tax=Dissoconium aciculare CBS 342.82 TaxID=1314786 RepID=A0A6J3M780_9PEZI|nr:uncharacterized protein K489DRAFT_379869 [Dissoconium aciculare CBS 342.82]KAF1823865.1 hypothetical protein K489DRAFT_379869 [Dissoconium aciculare CBS 342.82]